MNGFPDERLPGRIDQRGPRLILGAIDAPHIGDGWEHGDIGEHIALLQQGGEASFIIGEAAEIRPPGILFIEIGAVSYPTRERRRGRGIIKSMEYRMGYPGDSALVSGYLKDFQRIIEHHIRIRQLFAADMSFPIQVRCGADIFVDHRISPSYTVVRLAHLFPQTIFDPGLTFGQVDVEAAFQWKIPPSVGLDAGFYFIIPAPFRKGFYEAFADQLRLGQIEVITDPFDLIP